MGKRKFRRKENKISDIICSSDRFTIIGAVFDRKTGKYILTYQEPNNDEVLKCNGSKIYVETLFGQSDRSLRNYIKQ